MLKQARSYFRFLAEEARELVHGFRIMGRDMQIVFIVLTIMGAAIVLSSFFDITLFIKHVTKEFM